jgi:hypothetical protein
VGIVYDALAAHLLAGINFGSLDTIADELGGNPGMAMEIAGTSDKRSREYRNALRRVQRWRRTTGERRRPDPAVVDQLGQEARHRALRRPDLGNRARQRGVDMRLGASIRVSQTMRFHIMPAPAGNRPRYVHISGQRMRRVLQYFPADVGRVEGELLGAFFGAYWGDDDPLEEMGTIEMCEIR